METCGLYSCEDVYERERWKPMEQVIGTLEHFPPCPSLWCKSLAGLNKRRAIPLEAGRQPKIPAISSLWEITNPESLIVFRPPLLGL